MLRSPREGSIRRVVLASASPQRKNLLKQIGLRFDIEPSNCGEEIAPGSEPHETVRRLSLQKAAAVARKHRDALIIAADTLVVLEDMILGKPRTNLEAKGMLRALNGKTHSVITGFVILDAATGKVVSRSVETKVRMRKFRLGDIDRYVRTKEPLGKAGGYAIQGLGAVLVDRIEGDYFNVVGLPLSALAESLKEFGVNVLQPKSNQVVNPSMHRLSG